MSNTNHNVWTLTKHLAESANKVAGKIDEKFYSSTVQPVTPKPPTFAESHPILTGIGASLLGIVILIAFFAGAFKSDPNASRTEKVMDKLSWLS